MIRLVSLFLREHRVRGRALALLAVCGVAMGVAAVAAVQVLSAGAVAAVDGSARAVGEKAADLVVTAAAGNFPEAVLDTVLAVRGVRTAVPVVEAPLERAADPAGTWERARLVGTDLVTAWPAETGPGEVPAAAPLERGWAAFPGDLAESWGLSPGENVPVLANGRRGTLKVGTLLAPGDPAASPVVFADIAFAQDFLGLEGRLDRVYLRLDPGASPEAVQGALERRLGPSFHVRTPAERIREATSLLAAFRLNLIAMSLVSVFVAGLVVYASTLAALVRRRGDYGVLRSLGATAGQVQAVALGETAVLALPGTALGVVAGVLAGRLALDDVSATVQNLYLLDAIRQVRVSTELVAVALAVGVVGSLAAAAPAVRSLLRAAPRELLSPMSLHGRLRQRAGAYAAAGTAAAVLSWAAVLAWAPSWRYGGFVMAAAVLAWPAAVAPWALHAAFSRISLGRWIGLYGFRSVGARIQHGSFAVASLAAAAALMFGMTFMIDGFRTTLTRWLDRTLRADLYVAPAGGGADLDETWWKAALRTPGVRVADRLRRAHVWMDGRRVRVLGMDAGIRDLPPRFVFRDGDPDAAMKAVAAGEGALVSEPFAVHGGVRIGDPLRLPVGSGRPLRVSGVVADYAAESGTVIVSLETFLRWFGPGPLSGVAVYLEPGADGKVVARTLRDLRTGAVQIRSREGLRRRVLDVFRQTFAVTGLLRWLALLVAAVGVALSLLVSAEERRPEIALLRSLGATRRDVAAAFLAQAAAVAVAGLVLGFAAGCLLDWVLVDRVNRLWFGWTLDIVIPWRRALADAALVLMVAVLAGLVPAARAARVPAAELSREVL